MNRLVTSSRSHRSVFAFALMGVTLALATFLSAAAPSVASAQRGSRNKIDTIRVDIHADVGWWWALGSGFRLDIPIVPDGFLDGGVDDEFALSFGAEVGFVRWRDNRCNQYGCFNDWSVWPHVVAQWNFYLNESWSIFPEVGGSFAFYDCGPRDRAEVCVTGSPVIGFGARWHFAPPRVALLFRVIYPFGAQVGITF